jgi:pimeloyl-ACP methyl ester carboxylesterase
LSVTKATFSRLSHLAPAFFAKKALRLFLTPKLKDRPEWEKQFLARISPPQRFIAKNQYQFETWAVGEPGFPTVLCIHGWAGRGAQFGRFVEPLVEKGFRVVFFDAPGHLEKGPKGLTHMRAFAEAALELDKYFGPFEAVMGHSFGGAAAVTAYTLGLRTKRLILIASPSDLNRIFQFFFRAIHLSAPAVALFEKQIRALTGLDEREVSVKYMGDKIKIPVLLIHDPDDAQLFYDHSEMALAALPDAELFPVPGAGHYRILKTQAVITKVVELLSNSRA